MSIGKELSSIRTNYSLTVLDEEEIGADPVPFFETWLEESIRYKLKDANAMSLSTVSPDGMPSSRIVLLKEIDAGKFIFYSNYESHKGRDLEENPKAALLFFWPELERQVRIAGLVEKLDAQKADEYFHSRPFESQIAALASHQSEVISSRLDIQKKWEELEKEYKGKEIPRPSYWGGYALTPTSIEFWQGRPSRLHDRVHFRKENDSWIRERLSP